MSTSEEYRLDEWLSNYIEEEIRHIAEAPVFDYLAHHGDAIEERVRESLREAHSLREAGYPGAALARAVVGVEITIRFFLAHPLLQGAFLSDEWARLLTEKVLKPRTSDVRKLLPAILRNWGIDLTSVTLRNGKQMWQAFVERVLPRRNEFVHEGAIPSTDDAELALECSAILLDGVVSRVAKRLGFTKEESGCWSVVSALNSPEFPDLNPPRKYERRSPFRVPA